MASTTKRSFRAKAAAPVSKQLNKATGKEELLKGSAAPKTPSGNLKGWAKRGLSAPPGRMLTASPKPKESMTFEAEAERHERTGKSAPEGMGPKPEFRTISPKPGSPLEPYRKTLPNPPTRLGEPYRKTLSKPPTSSAEPYKKKRNLKGFQTMGSG